MQPGQNRYDAKVKVLGEQVRHHVKEEEEELFRQVRQTRLDLDAGGQDGGAQARPAQATVAAKIDLSGATVPTAGRIITKSEKPDTANSRTDRAFEPMVLGEGGKCTCGPIARPRS